VAGVQHAGVSAHPQHAFPGDGGGIGLAVRLAVELKNGVAPEHQRALGFGQGRDGLGLGACQQQGGVMRVGDAVPGLDGVLVNVRDKDRRAGCRPR
jgi:hypothetical protein